MKKLRISDSEKSRMNKLSTKALQGDPVAQKQWKDTVHHHCSYQQNKPKKATDGIRFYLEYPSKAEKNKATRKRPGNHSGNVLATIGRPYASDNGPLIDCIGAVYYQENAECAFTTVHIDYLRDNCKCISKQLALEIHPNLFKRIEC